MSGFTSILDLDGGARGTPIPMTCRQILLVYSLTGHICLACFALYFMIPKPS